MKFIVNKPLIFLDSNIPETDAQRWEVGRTYAEGEVVMSDQFPVGWQQVALNGYTSRSSLLDIKFGAEVYMAVGTQPSTEAGKYNVVKSSDGLSWESAGSMPINTGYISVAYGHDKWIVFAGQATRRFFLYGGGSFADIPGYIKVFDSVDAGSTWTLRYDVVLSSTFTNSFSVTRSKAVSANGVTMLPWYDGILRSTNGTAWSNVSAPGSANRMWQDIHYEDGVWMAVSDAAPDNLSGMISTDNGATWTQINLGAALNPRSRKLTSFDGDWYLLDGRDCYKSENNGTSWSGPLGSVSGTPTSLIYKNGLLIAATTSGFNVSPDFGATWIETPNVSSGGILASDPDDDLIVFLGSSLDNVFAADVNTLQPSYVSSTDVPQLYESLIADNVGKIPRDHTIEWLNLGPINKYRMFDQFIVSKTEFPEQIYAKINGTKITTIALFGVEANNLNVKLRENGTVIWEADYDLVYYNQSIRWMDYFFGPYSRRESIVVEFDAIATSANAEIEVTLTGPGFVRCGKLVAGWIKPLGLTQTGPMVGIEDFSRVTDDDFGRTTLVRRNFRKTLSCDVIVSTKAASAVQNVLAEQRATPTAWIGDNGVGIEAMLVYGIYRDFRIILANNGPDTSIANLEIRGMI